MTIIREALLPIAVLYALGALATLGHLYRGGERRLGSRQIICAAIWPIWWTVIPGLGSLLDAIHREVWGTDERAVCTSGFGLFTVGYYLSRNWSACNGGVECTGTLMQSIAMFFPPVNIAYWAWFISQSA
jgi:hypothetical protein